MPTTSNFGWTTPADTDLVKDGASAIRTLANGIDTSFLDLKGGTTGQVLSKNSNTDLDFIWTTSSAGISPTIFDAKGDLIVASAADTAARLASSGTNGNVLTVDTTTATGLKWSAPSTGALTYITGASFSASSAISFPNDTFTSTYDQYKVMFILTSASANSVIRFRLRASGADDSNATYYSGGAEVDSVGTETLTNTNNGTNFTWGTIKNANYPANFFDMTVFEPKVASPTRISAIGGVGGQGYAIVGGYFNANTSFDSMTIYPSTGTLTGRYKVYGLANS